MTTPGRRASEIFCDPPGIPESTTELPSSPRSSETSAPRRLTVEPSPAIKSPCAASGAEKTGADRGTTITATLFADARAGSASTAARTIPTARIWLIPLASKEADSR